MRIVVDQSQVVDRSDRKGPRLDGSVFGVLAALLDVGLIVLAAVSTGILYHLYAHARIGFPAEHAAVGCAAGVLFALPYAMRGQYKLETFIAGRRGLVSLFNSWSYAFLCLAFIAFMTRTTEDVSRGWIALFYLVGLLTVIGVDALVHWIARNAVRLGLVSPRRVMIIGGAREISGARRSIGSGERGAQVVASVTLPETVLAGKASDAELEAAMAEVVVLGRTRSVSEVVLALPLQDEQLAARIADSLLDLPVAVHIGQLGALARFRTLSVERLGSLTTLAVVVPPLSRVNALLKRCFDIVVASLALVLLSPLMLLIAVAIRLDSAGPVLFRQRRRGFNQEVFEIWKFRTMTTQDDGDVVVQARPGDARITRVGQLLRRVNLDELPQLVQVLTGKMSLVGPRPHAVAHDKHYERIIAQYARRLNVRPGITGWAQINGYRGSTRDDDDMQRRVAHDIHYIDNWSFPLDLYILVMTVLSPRAYRNAC